MSDRDSGMNGGPVDPADPNPQNPAPPSPRSNPSPGNHAPFVHGASPFLAETKKPFVERMCSTGMGGPLMKALHPGSSREGDDPGGIASELTQVEWHMRAHAVVAR
jgi:hypothetical protein